MLHPVTLTVIIASPDAFPVAVTVKVSDPVWDAGFTVIIPVLLDTMLTIPSCSPDTVNVVDRTDWLMDTLAVLTTSVPLNRASS